MRITPDRRCHRVLAGAGSSNSQGWSRTRPTGQRSRHSRYTSAGWRGAHDPVPRRRRQPLSERHACECRAGAASRILKCAREYAPSPNEEAGSTDGPTGDISARGSPWGGSRTCSGVVVPAPFLGLGSTRAPDRESVVSLRGASDRGMANPCGALRPADDRRRTHCSATLVDQGLVEARGLRWGGLRRVGGRSRIFIQPVVTQRR